MKENLVSIRQGTRENASSVVSSNRYNKISTRFGNTDTAHDTVGGKTHVEVHGGEQTERTDLAPQSSRRDGQVSLRWDDGAWYEGGVRGGKFHGEGTYSWPNGEKYRGGWVDGRREGRGEYTYGKGWRYSGWFREDELQGYGKIDVNGVLVYEGMFEKGMQHGGGTAYGVEGGVVQVLKGVWKDGQFQAERF